MVTHTRNLCSACTHPNCTHMALNTDTHTHREHTPGVMDSHLYAAVPGEQLGVRCLAQGHLSHGIECGEIAVHSLPHLKFLPTQDSNSQPFTYESDSLTNRPRLPHNLPIYEILKNKNHKNIKQHRCFAVTGI